MSFQKCKYSYSNQHNQNILLLSPKTFLTSLFRQSQPIAPGNHQSALVAISQFYLLYNFIYVKSHHRHSCFCLLLFCIFIHVVCVISFLFQISIPIYGYSTKWCPFFYPSSVVGHLSSLWFLVIMNKVSMSSHVQVFMRTCFLISSPGNRIAGIHTKHMFNFIRNCWTVLQSSWTNFTLVTAVNKSFTFSSCLLSFGIVHLLNFSYCSKLWC